MYNNYSKGGMCLVTTIIIIVLSFLKALIVQLLWNWLAPIFWSTAPILTYWQAFGICVLLGIIGLAFRSSK